jgi:hypothetical protein
MEQKAFTVRLDAEQAADLEAVAAADGVSVAEEVRQAIADRIEQRRRDPEFQSKIKAIMEQNRRVLERLAE